MPISYVPARDTTPKYAVFGKLPDHDDFIRLGHSTHPAAQEFDGVLARSLSHARQQPQWNEATVLRAGGSDFSYTTYDHRWSYFGALLSSHDKAGRLYPLVAGIILPLYAVAPVSVEFPIANELFFSGLREALSSAVNTGDLQDCQQFLASSAVPNPHARDDIDLAGQLLARHLASTPIDRLQTALSEECCFALDDVLLAFIVHADMLRRLGTSARKQVIALPLSGKTGETSLDQAMWLALYRAAVGKNKTHLSPDYIARNHDRCAFTLAPGRLGERCLGAVWGMTNEAASNLEIGAPDASWSRHSAWVAAAYDLGRQAQNPDTRIASLLSTIERIAGNGT